jgi:ankyrin repeat protein
MRTRHFDIVAQLLDAGANVNGTDIFGRSAFVYAAINGQIAMLDLLHANGGHVDLPDSHGDTPLAYALRECTDNTKSKCVEKLIQLGARLDEPCVQIALVLSGPAYIQLLIDAGFNVGELRNLEKSTPLHWVASHSRTSAATLDMLVNVCGIAVNARGFHGCTPCHNASSYGNIQTLRWLIDNGADVDVADADGETPLHAAGVLYVTTSMCVLLAAGANVHAVSKSGATALHCVAKLQDQADADEAVHLLLAAGADLDAVNDRGVTPRQLLSQRDYIVDPVKLEVARRLIAKTRLDHVRERALQVCIGLQSLELDALQMCEILTHACGAMASMIEFHQWWAIATKAKHFQI